MSIYSSGRKRRKHSRTHLGHLRITAYEDSSALVVKVHEVRGLLKKESRATQDVYVKLYLLPDKEKATKQKTRIKREKDPKFEEQFTWILSKEDQEKLLHVSVWARDSLSKNFMMGCMSFSMQDIIGPDKCIQGWYQLLDEENGMKGNSLVPSSIAKPSSPSGTPTPDSPPISSSLNCPLAYCTCCQSGGEPEGDEEGEYSYAEDSVVKRLAVTLSRGNDGFGFSVNGANPVYITRVQPGQVADEANLKVNDIIVEVEGIDVTKASGQVVVDLIRKNPHKISLLVMRNPARVVQSTSSYNMSSLTQPVDSLSTRHSTLNLATNRDQGAAVRRNLFYASQQQTSLNVDCSQDSNEFSQKSRASRGSLTQPLGGDLAGSERSLRRDSPQKPTGISRQSSSLLQGTSAHSSTAHSNGHLSGSQTEIVQNGIQNHHRPFSYSDDFPNPSTSSSNDMTRRLSLDCLDGADEVFQPMRATSETPATHLSVQHRFSLQPNHSRRNTLQGNYSNYAQSQMDGPVSRNSPNLRFYSSTQAYDVPQLVVTGRDMDRRYRGVAVSPPGNVQLTSSRRILSDEQLSANPTVSSSPYNRKLSDNDSALGGSVGDFNPSPLQVLHHKVVTIDWNNLDSREQKRQKALHQLLQEEIDFESKLQSGVQSFLRPLKQQYHILSASRHKVIFMNLEEIFSMTQDLCQTLRGRRQDFTSTDAPIPYYIPSFADIYQTRMRPIQHQYEKYLSSFECVGSELSLAFTRTTFANFIQSAMQTTNYQQSIHDFILLPKTHVTKVLNLMITISYLMASSHEDQKHLIPVIEALLTCCADKEVVRQYRKARDVMATLKLRVGFSNQVEKVTIDVPGRKLIDEGEVTLVQRRWKRNKKGWLLLFNDILLICLREGSIYSVIESPFILTKTTVQEIGGAEGTDFQINQVQQNNPKVIRCNSSPARSNWITKLETYVHSVSKSSSDRKETVRTRKLSNPAVDLAKVTSLSSKFDSSDSSVDVHSETMPPSNLPSPEKRKNKLGLFGVNTSARTKRSSTPDMDTRNPYHSISSGNLKSWSNSFDSLLESSSGRKLFEDFLKSEYSQENLQFWVACEQFKLIVNLNPADLEKEAEHIYQEYIRAEATRQVNLDHRTCAVIEKAMEEPSSTMFDEAQHFIYQLMARDSYGRFLKSKAFQEALKSTQ